MKINFPLEGFNNSGGVRIITQIANGLSKKDCTVNIIVPDYASSTRYYVSDKVKIRVVKTRGKGVLRKLYYLLCMLFKSCNDCDICIATGYKTSYYILVSKFLNFSKARLVYLLQGYDPDSLIKYGISNPLVRYLMYLIANISFFLPYKKIAVSEWINEKINSKADTIIKNGIDPKIFNPGNKNRANNSKISIGAFFSSAQNKGFDIFVRAIDLIPEDMKAKIQILIAGGRDFKLPERLKASIRNPANDYELAEFYRNCDIFVWTSYSEGFGLPPLEAMACKAAVITTDCGGIRAFADNENSVIIKIGDYKGLSDAIIVLSNDRELLNKLKYNSIRTSEIFSLEKMVEKYYLYFLSLTNVKH